MAHKTFKVCILIDDNTENFYIKHYIDQINPIFNRFKNQVFSRNPLVNSPNLKIYWIDAENDEILVACEEDFRLFLEEGNGRKIYFHVCNNSVQNNDPEEYITMESDENVCAGERKARKSTKDEEKKCRKFEKLSKKLRHYEDAFKNEEERSRHRQTEKRSSKNNERLERAKRRVEQIRSIIGSIDPANLNSNTENEPMPSTSSSSDNSVPNIQSPISPETIRLLSNAIAGCLQPCNVINKVLNDVFAIIPQVVEQTTGTLMNNNVIDQQQQTTYIPTTSMATNTSDANTPVHQANQEIEELFKEAAKELEKMNEIVNNSNNANKMEGSVSSLATENTECTQVTQIEKVFMNITDSAISNATIIDNLNESHYSEDKADGFADKMEAVEDAMASTPKFSRSRESSIEIHDVNSMMSDDSRDWTILSQDDILEPAQRIVDPKTGAIPKGSTVTKADETSCDIEIQTNDTSKCDSIKSVSIETQTPSSMLQEQFANQEKLQASVQKSLDIVQKSIETIHKSMENSDPKKPEMPQAAATVSADHNTDRDIYPNLPSAPPVVSEQTSQANLNATGLNRNKNDDRTKKAVIVYDPNPRINTAVHVMMNMGFSNEDNWLTQLLINVDGDIPKALNFLTPQPKNKKQ